MTDLIETVERLLKPEGDLQLPSLTREELFSLGDRPALVDQAAVEWREALTPSEQDLVKTTAQRSLLARNLLLARAGRPELDVDEQVAVLLAARRTPSWLAVLRGPDEPGGGVQIVVSGIDVEPGLTRAALISAGIEGIYAHRLLDAQKVPAELAAWLLRPTAPGWSGAPSATGGANRPAGRTIEVVRPSDSGPDSGGPERVGYAHAVVMVTPGGQTRWAKVSPDGDRAAPEPVTAPELAEWLAACGLLGEPARSAG
jgi:hypothetical protein